MNNNWFMQVCHRGYVAAATKSVPHCPGRMRGGDCPQWTHRSIRMGRLSLVCRELATTSLAMITARLRRAIPAVMFSLAASIAAEAPLALIDISPDSGLSNTDFVTNAATFDVRGVATPGQAVAVKVGSTAAGTATADAQGAWSVRLPTALVAGQYVLTAVTGSGVGARSSTLTMRVDLTAPAAPTNLVLTPDTGTSATDFVTSADAATITGKAEAQALVTLVLQAPGQTPVTTTSGRADASGAWTVQIPPGTPETTWAVLAQVEDVAGNILTGTASLRTLIIDRTPPPAPAITTLENDSGVVGDWITSVTAPAIAGTATGGATRVVVAVDGTAVGTVAVSATGTWRLVLPVLTPGSHLLTTQGIDLAGNQTVTTAASPATTLVIRTTAQPPTLTISDDTGMAGDWLTADNTIIVRGTAQPGDAVTVLGNGATWGTTTADATGQWSLDRTQTRLTDGTWRLIARVRDIAGLTAETPADLVVDTARPLTPTGVTFRSADAAAPQPLRSTLAVVASGQAESAVDILVFIDDVQYAVGRGGTATAWEVPFGPLTGGPHQVVIAARDAAGNVSVPTAPYQIMVEAPVMSAPTITSVMGSSGAIQPTTTDQIVISGRGTPGAQIVFVFTSDDPTIPPPPLTSAVVAADGSYTVIYGAMHAGTYRVVATAPGGVSSAPFSFTVTSVDQPQVPIIDALPTTIIANQSFMITGRAIPNLVINVEIQDMQVGTVRTVMAPVEPQGQWTVTAPPLPAGSYTVRATMNGQIWSPMIPFTVQASNPQPTSLTVNFTATLTSVTDPDHVLPPLPANDGLVGQYTYTLDAPGVMRSGGQMYDIDPARGQLRVASQSWGSAETSSGFLVGVWNNIAQSPWSPRVDFIRIAAGETVVAPSATVSVGCNSINLELEDPSLNAVTSDALPSGAPDLALWGGQRTVSVTLFSVDAAGNRLANADATLVYTLTSMSVPTPPQETINTSRAILDVVRNSDGTDVIYAGNSIEVSGHIPPVQGQTFAGLSVTARLEQTATTGSLDTMVAVSASGTFAIVLPGTTAGQHTVTVETWIGGQPVTSAAVGFVVQPGGATGLPAPVIESISAPAIAGQSITISGTGTPNYPVYLEFSTPVAPMVEAVAAPMPDGHWTVTVRLSAGGYSVRAALADVNGDGLPDSGWSAFRSITVQADTTGGGGTIPQGPVITSVTQGAATTLDPTLPVTISGTAGGLAGWTMVIFADQVEIRRVNVRADFTWFTPQDVILTAGEHVLTAYAESPQDPALRSTISPPLRVVVGAPVAVPRISSFTPFPHDGDIDPNPNSGYIRVAVSAEQLGWTMEVLVDAVVVKTDVATGDQSISIPPMTPGSHTITVRVIQPATQTSATSLPLVVNVPLAGG
jgi:hypothetical protein